MPPSPAPLKHTGLDYTQAPSTTPPPFPPNLLMVPAGFLPLGSGWKVTVAPFSPSPLFPPSNPLPPAFTH